ncbi:DNA modification methylase [Microbacterium enclense]|uniref:DNA modification methylase n=1 Tax=Microbacterium enclense TaxID=993073 RepID=UPI0021A90C68|nr:DNA modification methylase [Microbacterium enclense]MCT2086891.1 DNA modification methylase [Microbacterium enclense]
MPSVVPGGSVKTRLFASLAIGAAVVLGTTGCNLIAPQATTIDYSASDGVNVPESGPLQVRNALIVADDEGSAGNLVAAVVNDSTQAHTLRVEIGEGSDIVRASVNVPAGRTLSLGDLANGVEPLALEGFEGAPGSTVPVYFQSGDGEGALIQVPVLDGALEYLSPLAPTPTPTGLLAPTPTPSATPSPTPSS